MPVQRAKILRGFSLALLAVALAAPIKISASTIGLYTDQSGATCSFSGNQEGHLTVYAVVKPDADGIRGVRFSAPIPACLGAVFVSEEAALGALAIGSSDTGVSVAFPFCAMEPTYALQITYYRTSSDPCCEFPVLEDPFVGSIEGTDCAYDPVALTGSTTKFNADATCPCLDGHPPYPPHTPFPADWSTWASVSATLSWSPSQYDGDIVEYDVYLGTGSTPGLVATVALPMYQPPQPLLMTTQYFWRVVARDAEGLATSSPVWRFTTQLGNQPPVIPYGPSPANNAINLPVNTLTMEWECNDPNSDPLRYDVYFGAASPPPLVSSNQVFRTFTRTGLSYLTRYYWRVVARDTQGVETSGPEWSFTTVSNANRPPNTPVAYSPLPGAGNVSVKPVLQWTCTDPDGNTLRYAVYFGTTNPPPLVSGSQTSTGYNPGTLAFVTTYYWKIVASDPSGAQTDGPVWTFTTEVNDPPGVPYNPSPANGASNVSLDPSLGFQSTDEIGSLRYDMYFGTSSPPPLVATNAQGSYRPGPLVAASAYYWKVVVRDLQGLETAGPVWTFATIPNATPFGPAPPDNGYSADPLVLTWSTTDPGVHPILCDVYFGTASPPPLVATNLAAVSGASSFSFVPGITVVPGTRYYWRIVAHTTTGSASGPEWSLVGATRGDVNLDGIVDLDDAACALQVAIGSATCAAPGGTGLADVNCQGGVTPRDALCIHRRAIGQTCLFCGESSLAGGAALPLVTRSALWQEGSSIHATLAVSGVPALEAFSFWVRHPTNAPLVSAQRRGATGGFTALEIHTFSTHSIVGGYSLNAADASSTTDFIELRFQLGGTLLGSIYADTFVDDFTGAPVVTIALASGGKGGDLPVVFSRFDAVPDGDGVRIGWELQNEDVMEAYTIYRGVGGARPSVAIAHGELTGTTGSYLDRSVDAGQTYSYEMAVRAGAGDEFRSQIITVAMPGLELTLGTNHPNPFNPQTTIRYSIPAGGAPVRVRLAIYDASGRLVRVLVDEEQAGGARDVVWRGDGSDGKTVTSGVYFSVLQVGKERRTRKLVLLK